MGMMTETDGVNPDCKPVRERRRNKIKDYRRQDERPVERTQDLTPENRKKEERKKDAER
jgi:hypothetical protein